MMKLKHLSLLIFCLFIGVFMALAIFKNINLSDYQKVKTDSGLTVFFLKEKSLPYVQFRIMFPKAGADYDFLNRAGLASLTAYLSEQGAGGLSSEELQEALNQLGTELELSVNRQTVNFVLQGLSWHSEKLWDLFKKIISEPHFNKDELDILKKQFLESRLKQLDRPSFVANSVWRKRLFPGVIGQDRSGTLKSLAKISLQDIKDFYKKQYVKGGPVLMVVGDYNKQLKKEIVAFFNKQFSGLSEELKSIDFVDLDPEFKLLTKKSLLQAEVILGYPIGAFPVNNPREFLVLQLANAILGAGSMDNRLFTEIREKRGLTYSIHSFISFGKKYGVFGVSGSTRTKAVKEYLEQTLAVLNNYKTHGATKQELERARRILKSSQLLKMETPESRLNQQVYYNYYLGLDPSFLKNYQKILNQISLDELNKIIKKFVLSKPLQVLVYGHPLLEAELQGIEGLAPLKTLSFKEYFKEELSLISSKK